MPRSVTAAESTSTSNSLQPGQIAETASSSAEVRRAQVAFAVGVPGPPGVTGPPDSSISEKHPLAAVQAGRPNWSR